MAVRIPAIFLEINANGIEQIRVAAERDSCHQRQAAKFYADLSDAIFRLDEEIKRIQRKEPATEDTVRVDNK